MLHPNAGDYGGPASHRSPHPSSTLDPLNPNKQAPPAGPWSAQYGVRFNTDSLTGPRRRRRRRSSDAHSRSSSKNLISPRNTAYPNGAYYDDVDEEEEDGGDGGDDASHINGSSSPVATTTRPASANTHAEALARAWADLAAPLLRRRRWWLLLPAVVGALALAAYGRWWGLASRGGEPARFASERARAADEVAAAAGRRHARQARRFGDDLFGDRTGGFDLGVAVLRPVAAAYGRWLRGTGAEAWFADARDADDVLEALYVAWTPSPVDVVAAEEEEEEEGRGPSSSSNTTTTTTTPTAAAARVRIRHGLDLRATHRRRAEVLFENFLHARLAAAERLLEKARFFQIYVGKRLGGGLGSYRPSRAAVAAAERVYGFVDARVPSDNARGAAAAMSQADRANLTLHHAGARFLRNMEATHVTLYAERAIPPLPGADDAPQYVRRAAAVAAAESKSRTPQHRRLAAVADVERAADADQAFVDDLLRGHPWRALWTPTHAGALRRLARQLRRVEADIQAVEARLSWHAEQLEAAAAAATATWAAAEKDGEEKKPGAAAPRLVWVQAADDIVAGLESLLLAGVAPLTWARRHREALRRYASDRDLAGWRAWWFQRNKMTEASNIHQDGTMSYPKPAHENEIKDGILRWPVTGIQVVVVGAGPGGYLAALECWRKGHEVVILEKHPKNSPIGDVVFIGPSGLVSLHNYPTMLKEYTECSWDCVTSMRNINGKPVCPPMELEFNRPDVPHHASWPLRIRSMVNRAELADMFARQCDRLGIPVLFNVNVVDYTEDTAEKTATAIAEDGRRFTSDIVIAADGLGTKSHKSIVGRAIRAVPTGFSICRVFFRLDREKHTDLIEMIGHGGRPDLRTHSGNDFHFILITSPDSVTIAYTHKDEGACKESWAETITSAEFTNMLPNTKDWDPLIMESIRNIPDQTIIKWQLCWRDPQLKWTSPQGRIIQLGDSAHAFIPSSISGATTALEDAISLAECLRLAGRTEAPIGTKVHELLRIRRVSVLQRLGFSNRQEMHRPGGMEETVQQAPASGPMGLGKWIWTHNPEHYAAEKFVSALCHLRAGSQFNHENLPIGFKWEPWSMDDELTKEKQGITGSDLKSNGDWGIY